MSMAFSHSIQGISEKGFSPLWQMAENYLDVGQKVLRIRTISENDLRCKEEMSQQKFLITALKIASFATLFLPLIAICVAAYNRSKYTFQLIQYPSSGNQEKAHIENWIAQGDIAPCGPHFKNEGKMWMKEYESHIQMLLKKDRVEERIDLKELSLQDVAEREKVLKSSFVNLFLYFAHQDDVLSIARCALQRLLDGKSDDISVAFARMVYKNGSAFLRKYVDPKKLHDYQAHSETELFPSWSVVSFANPRNYLFEGVANVPQQGLAKHAALIHVLRHLRKRIKLITKQKKVSDLLDASITLQKTSSLIREKARRYLGLMWLHGTKAYVIKAACEKTGREVLTTGELARRCIQPICGEMEVGTTAIGINREHLSGVNLATAKIAREYAHNFALNLSEEKRFYSWFLKKRFSSFEDCLEKGNYSRALQALLRIHSIAPQELDVQVLAGKLHEMYDIVEKIFSEKPKEIFTWGDNYYSSKFYSFLKFLESFAAFLSFPPRQDITEEDIDLANCPLILGSTKKLGKPARLSCYEEPREEVIGDHMLLGTDIDVVFTNRESVETVQELVRRYGLGTSVAVETFDVMEAASQMDRDLGPYFYDYYNQKKWARELKGK